MATGERARAAPTRKCRRRNGRRARSPDLPVHHPSKIGMRQRYGRCGVRPVHLDRCATAKQGQARLVHERGELARALPRLNVQRSIPRSAWGRTNQSKLLVAFPNELCSIDDVDIAHMPAVGARYDPAEVHERPDGECRRHTPAGLVLIAWHQSCESLAHPLIASRSSTSVTPVVAHAARRASARSGQERTVPVSVTLPPVAVTRIFFASVSAVRLSAAVMCCATS